ncbi:ATP synthase B/B' CF(0) [Desulfacinum hydrothermale DSM 13146]|uniref:ATP synthase subunit b n=1 Tax=Desulfacinum hydrothermale DSM 13146 TaxID=1121390 RepID=A0A1W1WYV7_9BACT|nr:F0F1 ATP synthase subunit B [Desulfacinum hydrothermale]SMC16906.1 ATP synthase B/B' CF(0) [Desulfacinum hydrothermale DSM 13146]
MWKLTMGALAALGAVVMAADPAAASSTVFGIERATWDLAWRWINFGIFVFLLVKYLKDPLVSFLKERREEIAQVFERLEEKEEALKRQQEEQERLLAQLDEKIESIRAHYHQIGQEEKEKILAQAERTRKQILEDAKAAAQRDFEEAKKRFRAEVVDMAVALAEQRLKKKITKKDQTKLLQAYLGQLKKVEPKAS